MRGILIPEDTNKVTAVVDVWCEAPMKSEWLETVDSLAELKEEGFNYSFVVGESMDSRSPPSDCTERMHARLKPVDLALPSAPKLTLSLLCNQAPIRTKRTGTPTSWRRLTRRHTRITYVAAGARSGW